ncbi:MAG: SGNH/GDSL hydrolase family protein [Anaerolineae bacterium]|nr:SGNH/GDSL hydrolase family protein [Anaerolineae bacterium]
MSYWVAYLLLLVLGVGGLAIGLVYVSRAKPTRPILQNVILMMLTIFLTLMAVEFYFKVFFAQPDALPTLAVQNWHQRYYEGTINSWGYRDVEWTPELVDNKTKVMVVGDSFVEGVGIENPQDRFPDQLAQKLGPKYVVLNLGKRRANTVQEIEAILNYPYPPDILVLSYFVNDIDDVRWWYNTGRELGPSVPPLLSPLVRNSYAFNFLYWRLYRLLQAGQPDAEWLHLLGLYNNLEAWWTHQQDLLSIYEGAKSEQIPFMVIVFPSMNRPEESKVVTERIIALLESWNVPVLDVANLIQGIPTDELTASPVDPHPGERVHALVAEALYDLFVAQKLVQPAEARQE